jgi:hypothetical protein
MIKDIEYWQNLSPPLCPNSYEVELYRHHSKGYGPVCLLGMTKELQPLCEFMIDLHPVQQTKPVIKSDWRDIKEFAEVFIGDGVVNLEGLDLVDDLLKIAEKVVVRVFLKKFSWMKYATHFPNKFPGSSLVVPTQEDIAMVIWEK